jgi:hypothetical protein
VWSRLKIKGRGEVLDEGRGTRELLLVLLLLMLLLLLLLLLLVLLLLLLLLLEAAYARE